MPPFYNKNISVEDDPLGAGAPTQANSAYSSRWFSVGVLCFVNLINYMDRFTIAGVLTDIQIDFDISDDYAGLLQTCFILSYMLCAPLFGYLGDRYSRRWLMAVGVCLWSTTTLLGSFMKTFGWFITCRAFVGIGEASYSTIAPTTISDLFVYNMRSNMLAMFYFAIPVGSGLGYIVGAKTASIAGNWRWALRVTPFLGIVAVVLILFTKDPERGASEGSQNLTPTSYAKDIKNLVKNRSFMLSTAGFTCVTYVTGAFAWWAPKFMHLGFSMQSDYESITLDDVAFKFGAITMIAGIIGVPLGSFLSQVSIQRYPKADPLLCALGLFISIPLLTGAMIVVSKYIYATYVLVFFGQLALNINWAIIADILLYVVVPTRRSTAEAFQILFSHAFGDAFSPYIIGILSEVFKGYLRTTVDETNIVDHIENEFRSLPIQSKQLSTKTFIVEQDTTLTKFKALQYALFSTSFFELLGGIFFLITAVFIIKDKHSASVAPRKGTSTVPNYPAADI